MSKSFLEVRSICVLARSGLLLWFASAGAEQRIFDTAEAWQAWRLPAGLVHFDESGALRLRRFERRINPVIDAGEYLHQTRERGILRGGIWQVGSNPESALRVIDGVAQTFWKPDPNDGLRNWLIEVDLGRVVLAQEVVLYFPDLPGARPFRQFGVFTSSGHRFRGRSDDVVYPPGSLQYYAAQPRDPDPYSARIRQGRHTSGSGYGCGYRGGAAFFAGAIRAARSS